MSLPRLIRRLAGPTSLALIVTACGGAGHATPGRTLPQRTAPLESMFEAQPQLLAAPAPTVQLLQALGVDTIRVFVPWASLAASPDSTVMPVGLAASSPAAYSASAWAPYDAIVRAASARDVAVDLTLEGPPPLWASGAGAPAGTHPQWRPDARAYSAFVQAVATRYSGRYSPAGAGASLPRVRMWSIWNEPNYGPQLAPQAIDNSTVEVAPALYRRLLDAAWASLGATGHGHDTVLIGELAPRGLTTGDNPGNFSGMVPLRFLRALYCVDGSLHELQGAAAQARDCPSGGGARAAFVNAHPALFAAGGFALHLYPFGAGEPNQATPGEPDYADLATVARFERVLDRIVAGYGSTKRFAIYDTEFGYKTNPPFVGGAPPDTAAAYLNWAEYLHWRDSRIRSYDQYLLTDPAGHSDFATGLLYLNGTPKPLYAAYRLPLFLPVTAAAHGAKLEVWGCVRAADVVTARTGRSPPVQLQFAPSSSHSFRTLEQIRATSPNGYFDVAVGFPASGTVRLAWSDPVGGTIYSRSVAVSVG